MVEARVVDKKIKVVKKAVKKEMKKEKKFQNKKNAKHEADILMLRNEIEKLKKKKVSRGHVSEYNIFIRKQIKSGMTFSNAAKQWSKYKALESKNKRRPSAYNQFIGSQMRLGKTWVQAVALWKLAKAGKLGKKGINKTVTKTVVKKIKSKPQIKYRTRTRTIIKKVNSKPVKRTFTRIVRSSPGVDVSQLTKAFESSMSSHSISKGDLKEAFSPDEEEIAFKIIQTYFIEIARQGFKRQLTLDEIINAYFYALARVKNKKN
ncbi:MAG: hypothetical protein PHY04_03080 [Candidatus ainarchaeum sp.]|jgi:hypothetical protein|nr:hypothetical protein [Candidatus ainarchaeum sp.]MDD3086048.1 hypothetical protein [Candidatus ainarchaeum sp.]MDD4128692.1 hypothetical protein [Candidatus ainarchaeum sp.]MDD4468059.1 hypothetical protein [Candidatus ainarchaeum sp.]HPM85881.1 hypothetical protein [archaeon]